MESHGLQDMHPKPLTTPKRYGAGMAHNVTSIVHALSWSYCGLLWIIDYHGLSWIILDYLGQHFEGLRLIGYELGMDHRK